MGVVAGARRGIDAPWDAANADAFVGLMTGTVVGTLIPVTVLQTSAGEEPGTVPDQSRACREVALCVDATLIDLTVVPEPSVGTGRRRGWPGGCGPRIGIAGSRVPAPGVPV